MKLKHGKNKKRTPYIIIAVVCVVLAAIVASVVFIIGNQPSSSSESTSSTSSLVTETVTQKKTTPATEKPTTAPTEPTTKKTPEDNPEFTSLIKENGYSSDDLKGKQLIVVKSNGTNARLSFFEKKDGAWDYSDALNTADGFVGTQGVSENASEYASYTPKGYFPLGTGFGINDNPGTKLDYFKVTENSYWVDDVNSQYYNQHIEINPNEATPGGEHLIDYKGYYNYAVFIGYNSDPAISGKGSAFFLHIGNEPTAGCVAIPEESMLKAIRWLNKDKSPYIMIF
ncbi:MAG: hypothetical protein J1E41_00350 [Ruminococcus sp.]|nr:hypothetical protein [Ruminococcus sp.]